MKSFLILFSVIALLFAGNTARAANNQSCQIECSKCASVCESTLKRCQKSGGKHAESDHIKAMRDCVDLCKLSAKLMARHSALQNKLCRVCEEACNTCASSCEAMKDDKAMQDCAKECRKCANECKKMAE